MCSVLGLLKMSASSKHLLHLGHCINSPLPLECTFPTQLKPILVAFQDSSSASSWSLPKSSEVAFLAPGCCLQHRVIHAWLRLASPPTIPIRFFPLVEEPHIFSWHMACYSKALYWDVAMCLDSSLWHIIGSVTCDFWKVSWKGKSMLAFFFIFAVNQKAQSGMAESHL